MADFSGVYDETRRRLCEFVSSLTEADQHRPVPATPGWTVHDVVAHVTGDLAAVQAGDFPSSFFAALGDQEEVVKLNAWTARMVEERRDRPTRDVLGEWELRTAAAMEMLRGEKPLPSGLPSFGDRVLITDIGVHEQDIYGAFGVVRARGCSAVRIGTSLYVAGVWLRLNGLDPVRFETDKKTYQAGEGEPGATARTTLFELFRALSGRRGRDQIRAWEWSADPEPYLSLFYVYGPRGEALVER
jgi:uncharacterized protein (TIGR03083 family)